MLISIHAPREGGDDRVFISDRVSNISIHAPREGGDFDLLFDVLKQAEFQSTPPARGATLRTNRYTDIRKFQSTPPARGATFLLLFFV